MAKAKTEARPEGKADEKVPDPAGAMARLAELTRRVIAVPKSEVVDPPKPKKRKH
jgi:hypothetical protein